MGDLHKKLKPMQSIDIICPNPEVVRITNADPHRAASLIIEMHFDMRIESPPKPIIGEI
jgi:hypothetical protein